MTGGSQHHFGSRPAGRAVRPATKPILRAQMTALAQRLYGPDMPAEYHRKLAVDLFQTRRRAAER